MLARCARASIFGKNAPAFALRMQGGRAWISTKSTPPSGPKKAPEVELGCIQDLSVPAYVVWGAGTDVGKTLISAGICEYFSRVNKDGAVLFLKPFQTGYPEDSDADTVAGVCGGRSEVGDHAQELLLAGEEVTEFPCLLNPKDSNVVARTEYAWSQPVSPHLAVQLEGRAVTDGQIISSLQKSLGKFAATDGKLPGSMALVETAGAVNSPGPAGTGQVDMLRTLRLPGILIGDGRIGGISSTVCALESLLLRGVEISCVIMIDQGLQNEAAVAAMVSQGGFRSVSGKTMPVIVLPPLPRRRQARITAQALRSWFSASTAKFKKIANIMQSEHKERLAQLASAAERTEKMLWWPFTQHDLVKHVTVIDSRHGEDWWVYQDGGPAGDPPGLKRMLDGSASWWTQGVDASLHANLTRAIAYGSGRYGHVLFPETTNEAALGVARRLLEEGPGKGWATRVFFSDDGSTAVEVGLKMAFRKYMSDKGLLAKSEEELAGLRLRIVGMDGSYHGDTLGAMDCQAPSIFTGMKQMPWYDPRGYWIPSPSLGIVKGTWTLSLPFELTGVGAAELTFASKEAALDAKGREGGAVHKGYQALVKQSFDKAEEGGMTVGAVMLEAVMHGAGGMYMVDPLMQRTIAAEARTRGIPVVLDEVFAGLWRLGLVSAASIPGIVPDVACYAKLLTGGTIPMAVTLASEEIFETFRGSEKSDALLHGHSYTAHPTGCAVACAAMDIYSSADHNPNYQGEGKPLSPLWDEAKAAALSSSPGVARVLPMGTILAVELEVEGGGGYASGAAKGVVAKLKELGVHARPLGNVVYLMVTPTTQPSKCDKLIEILSEALKHR
mmetsp:Transcript_37594/g.88864  ORF Transcript_37594/g.88864 Transcript_37594/m.88864 type:complete len:839 (+) Transcript_37594:57-2573(+)